ncbi:MAG: serine hydrolase domain-containing protein [Actinomycetota bacterium]|nr:serine hydrolase domain-containing protein [Actinomycetota bacterium]
MDRLRANHHGGRWTAIMLAALLVLAALACSSCGGSQDTPDGATSLPPEIQRGLEDKLSGVMEDNGIPGAIIYVDVPGKGTWEAAIGLADVEAGEAMDTALRFHIGSITKTFVSTMILQLVDEGKMSLDDTLEELGIQPAVPYAGDITLRMLLNHTSGIFDYTADADFQAASDDDFLRKWTPRELVAFAAANQPYFPPGEGWEYSNTNFILQGMIIEELTGGSLEDELQERITSRLGLSATTLPDSPRISAEHSHGYAYAAVITGDEADGGGELMDITETFNTSWGMGGWRHGLRPGRSRGLGQSPRRRRPALRRAPAGEDGNQRSLVRGELRPGDRRLQGLLGPPRGHPRLLQRHVLQSRERRLYNPGSEQEPKRYRLRQLPDLHGPGGYPDRRLTQYAGPGRPAQAGNGDQAGDPRMVAATLYPCLAF